MTCSKCQGFVITCNEIDEDGYVVECEKCLNCGLRRYIEPVGKCIQVEKGRTYGV